MPKHSSAASDAPLSSGAFLLEIFRCAVPLTHNAAECPAALAAAVGTAVGQAFARLRQLPGAVSAPCKDVPLQMLVTPECAAYCNDAAGLATSLAAAAAQAAAGHESADHAPADAGTNRPAVFTLSVPPEAQVRTAAFSPEILEAAAADLSAGASAVVLLCCRLSPAAETDPPATAGNAALCEAFLLLPAPAATPALADTASTVASTVQTAAVPGSAAAPAGGAEAGDVEEIVLGGVRYADLPCADGPVRMGALTPLWRQELPGFPPTPDAEALRELESRGVYLGSAAAAPPSAIICCGQGAVWPGMGRELYDNFPAARAAMDRIAAVADWDVLGLMDETDVEIITPTRRQQPYVFLLEYAQWSHLASLGLQPSVMCGHSLGELIALCFAGVYTPETAWYILDTRASHMAEMEAEATRETGMMAVHAEASVIEEARAAWPTLYVSNYNTPRQYILSGPRDMLTEVRKSLRKRRIPAIMLNVSLAFHHPNMRVLRELSLRRLNALDMHAPRLPILSNITTELYPSDQPGICRHIADLDENSVRWTECVAALWQKHGIRHFVELGPQDTLCGLVADIEPRALCLPAGRKGRELEGMRRTCAALYALGHLPRAVLRRRAAEAVQDAAQDVAQDAALGRASEPAAATKARKDDAAADAAAGVAAVPQEAMRTVMEALARAAGRPAADLRPEMDLRYDLSLRSSSFPLIIQEVEQRLGLNVNFEDLLEVSTIGDLARALSGIKAEKGDPSAATGAPGAAKSPHKGGAAPLVQAGKGYGSLPPLRRFVSQRLQENPADNADRRVPLPLDPCGRGLPLGTGRIRVCTAPDERYLPDLLSGIAPLGVSLLLPEAACARCAALETLGARLIADAADASIAPNAPADTAANAEAVQGLLVLLRGTSADESALAKAAAALKNAARTGLGWVFCLVLCEAAAVGASEAAAAAQELRACARQADTVFRLVFWEDDGRKPALYESGDMLARELLRGEAEEVLWARERAPEYAADTVQTLLRPQSFPLVFADPAPPLLPAAGLFQGACHFSRFADPALSAYGGLADAATDDALPQLPFSRALGAMLESTRILLPWLQISGFCDLRFFEPLPLPAGVTRECRLTATAQPWLRQDGMSRLCRVRLEARKITANGRRIGTYTPVAEGMVLAAAEAGEPLLLWDAQACREAAAAQHGDAAAELASFYDTFGLGEPWRLLSACTALPDNLYSATLRLPAAATTAGACEQGGEGAGSGAGTGGGIAPDENSGYNAMIYMIEGIIQAAALSMTHLLDPAADDTAPAAQNEFRLNAAGFVRRSAVAAVHAPFMLQWRQSWADDKLLRFDAQVIDADGKLLLTLHHLEFTRRPMPAPAGEEALPPEGQSSSV